MKITVSRWTLAAVAATLLVPLAVLAAEMGGAASRPAAGMRERMKERMTERREGGMAGQQGMMLQMPEGMQMRMKVMMNHKMEAMDPAGILALREDLKLTPDQVQKLEAMVKEAGDKTSEMLTPEQRDMLKPMEGTPMTMKEIHQEMMGMMKKQFPNMMFYTCPMHPEVKENQEGKCPKCGMTLMLMIPDPMALMPPMVKGEGGMMMNEGMKGQGGMRERMRERMGERMGEKPGAYTYDPSNGPTSTGPGGEYRVKP